MGKLTKKQTDNFMYTIGGIIVLFFVLFILSTIINKKETGVEESTKVSSLQINNKDFYYSINKIKRVCLDITPDQLQSKIKSKKWAIEEYFYSGTYYLNINTEKDKDFNLKSSTSFICLGYYKPAGESANYCKYYLKGICDVGDLSDIFTEESCNVLSSITDKWITSLKDKEF